MEHLCFEKKTDFYIKERPVSIILTCPHCANDVEIPWREVNAPECWSDDWGYATCPECSESILLGDYDCG